MKKKISLLLILCSFALSYSQITFTEHVLPLDSNVTFTNMNCSDVDGDGDLDIITSTSANDLLWHENLDGLGYSFSTQNLINDEGRDPRSPITGDFDGDGDMDFAAISFQFVNQIYWQENTDGNGAFGIKITIDNTMARPRDLISTDIDNDGDTDLILVCGSLETSSIQDNVILYRNDGSANFTKEVISTFDDVTSVNICDIDGDNDIDIIAGNYFDGNAYWYENLDGLGNFAEANQFSSINYITSLDYADMDGDNDTDIILSSDNDYNVLWYENTDGQGTFTEHIIGDYNQEQSSKVLAVDVNNDGKMDIVSQKIQGEDIVWYENTDGLGVFGNEQLIHGELSDIEDIIAVDFNEDGRMDIGAISSSGDIELAWYENLGLGSNKIQGTLTVDSNINGCDASDIVVPQMMIVADNGTETLASFTLSNGYYALYPQEGSYVTSVSSPLLDVYTSNPVSHDFDFIGIGTIVTGDFCIIPISGFSDLLVSTYPLSDAVPGFQADYRIVIKNVGPTILSGDVVFQYDEVKLSYSSATEPVTSQTANSITIDYTGLVPFETRYIDVSFDVFTPPITEIDNILSFITTINPISGDANEDDNVFDFEQIVVGSYDPNDIRVMEGDEIQFEDASKYLHYIIRFQNTGTASAINVNVENVLDDKLDWTTMQLETLSHEGRVEITNGSEVNFIFDDINLADSTNDEPNSHGFIAYKIKPKSDVLVGDIFNNTADIFFDFNPAIVTNTVSTEIVENLSIEDYTANSVLLFPNPTENQLTIKSKSLINKIKVLDVNGRLLNSKAYSNSQLEFQVDVSMLSQGLYFLEINSDNSEQVLRFIKK